MILELSTFYILPRKPENGLTKPLAILDEPSFLKDTLASHGSPFYKHTLLPYSLQKL